MERLSRLVFAVLLCTFGAAASAAVMLHADLTNSQELPPPGLTTSSGAPRPASFGSADFLLDDLAVPTFMTMMVTIFNIDVTGTQTADVNDNLVAAHIHAPASAFSTAPVVWGFFGAPFNDNNPGDFSLIAFATGVGGVFSGKWDGPEGNNTTLPAQIPNILAELAYINFHTVQNPGGEIRGQILRVHEPPLLGLAGLALLLLTVNRRHCSTRAP